MAEKTYYIVLQNQTSDLCIRSPSAEEIEALMFKPEKFYSIPNFEGIDLQCCSKLSRGNPKYKTGIVEIYFDHKGSCILTYNSNTGNGTNVLLNPVCNSNTKVSIGTIHGPDCFFKERNWVPVEIAHKYVQEFCDFGEILVSTPLWEKWTSDK